MTEVKCEQFNLSKSNSVYLIFSNCSIPKINVIESNGADLSFSDGDYDQLNVDNSVIKLKIEGLLKSITFHELKIDRFYQTITVSNAILRSVEINNISSSDSIRFTNVSISEKFEIIDSRISNAKFYNVNFYLAKFKLLDSSISESTFINIRWPRKHLINEEILNMDNRLDKLWGMREAYRQLKIVSENQHNKIESLAFKKHELKIYWRIVSIETWRKGCESWWYHFSDWLILFTNKIFSDFGQSMALPLLWLLIVDLLLFNRLLYLYDLGVYPDIENGTKEAFWKGLGLYVNLLNPVHSFEIKKVSILGFTDFIMRLLSGYFIYYFIKATRKFNF